MRTNDAAVHTKGQRSLLKTFQRDCQAKEVVSLKRGAQVLLLKNLDTAAGLCNGSRGCVIEFVTYKEASEAGQIELSQEEKASFGAWLRKNPTLPVVMFSGVDGNAESSITRVMMPEKFEREVDKAWAVRFQMPLRLAWALTIHKSQGMTLDRVTINLNNTFECGQAYVALSRARSLEGLELSSFDPKVIRADPTVLASAHPRTRTRTRTPTHP